jgi:hypothetical protein
VRSQSGDAEAAIASADVARRLSPFDPLLFGMLASRAMALARLHQFDEASAWAVKAADRPNAHVHIRALAALILALDGSVEEGQSRIAALRREMPAYSLKDFLAAFQFDDAGEMLFRQAARLLAMQ